MRQYKVKGGTVNDGVNLKIYQFLKTDLSENQIHQIYQLYSSIKWLDFTSRVSGRKQNIGSAPHYKNIDRKNQTMISICFRSGVRAAEKNTPV